MALPRRIAPPLATLAVLVASTVASGQPFRCQADDCGIAPNHAAACIPGSWGSSLAVVGPTWVPRAWMTGAAAWQPVIEPEPAVPETGYVDVTLSQQERQALRRSLKLPLDALAEADSTDALKRLAVVQPAPNPAKPFLPIETVEGDDQLDPFATNRPSAATRGSLGALSRLFDAEDSDAGIAPKPAAADAMDDSGDDPFAGGSETTAEPAAEEDPFAVEGAADESLVPANGAATEAEGAPAATEPPAAEEDDPFADF
jgi:hypothetical protein